MATTVGSHSVAAFVNPSNGDALDATVVKGNDNTLRTAYVNHDADTGIHVQSSALASRPAAGTAGRKWMTTDGGVKLWYDTGSVWEEVAYVPATGTASLTDVTISGSLTVDTTTLVVDNSNNRVGVGTATPGVALDVVGTTRTSNGLTVTAGGATVTAGGLTVSAGGIAVTGNSTIAGTLGSLTGVTVSGTVTATTFSGSGASLTNLPAAELTGTLPAISGANLTSLNASNLSSGTVAVARLPTTFTSALTIDPGVNQLALTIAKGCNITFTTNSGAAASRPAFIFASDYNGTGANTPPALGSSIIAGSSWVWLRVEYVAGQTGYIPILV